jgi:hypothetical protein
MRHQNIARIVTGFVFIASAACGNRTTSPGDDGGGKNKDGDPGVVVGDGTGPYYPLKIGNTWSYWVTKAGFGNTDPPYVKVVTAEKEELVGGEGLNANTMAIKVVTAKRGPDKTHSWQGSKQTPKGTIWVRYREQAFDPFTGGEDVEDWWDPYRLRLDETTDRTAKGANWKEVLKEFERAGNTAVVRKDKEIVWEVLAVNETLTIQPRSTDPKKVYKHCLQVRHSNAFGTAWKTFWFCRGVGKVKEVGDQTEELVDHKVTWP